MSGNAPVPPPPPHSEPAAQPPVFQPRPQQPASPPPPAPPAGADQPTAYQPAQPAYGQDQPTAYQPAQPAYGQDQATAYQPVQPAYQPPAYQQQPAYQQPPAYQAPPPAFAPGSGQPAAHPAPPVQQPPYSSPPPQQAPQQYPAHQQYPAQQPPQQAYQPASSEQPRPASPADAPGNGPRSGPGGGRPGKGGRRLSPGWIAFIALDVILVGIVIAFAISLAGGDGGPDTAQDPGTVVQVPAETPDAPVDEPGPVVVTGESVTSPSRNITCTIGDAGVSCGIAELAAQPAPVDGCTGTTGYVATLTADGVQIPCVPSADQPRKAADGVPVLEYDQTKTVGSFTCTSSKTGMRCTDSGTGKGFNMAKAGVSSF